MTKTANLRIRIDENVLPFESRQPRYNAETEAAIQEARDIMSGKIQTKTYSSLAEFYADLESEDSDDEI